MTIVAGVDAGGSRTVAVIGDLSGSELGRSTGAHANAATSGPSAAAATIAATVRNALDQTAFAAPIASLVVGAAGAGRDRHRDALHAALAEQQIAQKLQVTTDAAVALESAFPAALGVVLIAGTGSIAYARDPAGEVCRVGGHGPRFGDDGSGFSLARGAIGAALRAHEGRGPATVLEQVLWAATATESNGDFQEWIEQAGTDQVARLAEAVCNAAAGGDEVAVSLVRDAGRSLADHVVALLPRFDHRNSVQVALHGGLIVPDTAVRRVLLTELATRAPAVEVCRGAVDPASGALRLAVQALRT